MPNTIKFEVKIELDLHAYDEEDAHNIIRDIREAVRKFRGVDGISSFIKDSRWKNTI